MTIFDNLKAITPKHAIEATHALIALDHDIMLIKFVLKCVDNRIGSSKVIIWTSLFLAIFDNFKDQVIDLCGS